MGRINYLDIQNTIAECGNMGGIGTEVYYAPASDFVELAQKPGCDLTGVEIDTLGKLSVGADVLKLGKSLHRIYTTMEKGMLKAEKQGEIDGVSNKITLALFTPGLDAKSLGILEIPNQSWIFYVKTGKQMFRVGNKAYPAKLSPDGEAGTGDSTASLKGNSLNFFCYEVGFAGEVVDMQAIEDMLYVEDLAFTITTTPIDNAVGVALSDSVVVLWSEDLQATDTELLNVFKLQSLDLNGQAVADIDFTVDSRTAAGFTLNPVVDFDASTLYRVSFSKSGAVSLSGKFTGSDNDIRFITV